MSTSVVGDEILLQHPDAPCPLCLRVDDLKPEDFRIGATDSQGHRERIHVPVHPLMALQLANVQASGNWPYRSVQDIMRHAAHRHLQLLDRLAPIMNSLMAQLQAVQILLQTGEALQDMQQVIKGLHAPVQTLVADGQQELARIQVMAFKTQIDRIPEDDKWKPYYLETMDKFFAEQMVTPPGAEPVSLAFFTEPQAELGG